MTRSSAGTFVESEDHVGSLPKCNLCSYYNWADQSFISSIVGVDFSYHRARLHHAMVTGARWARVGAVLDIFLQGLKRISIFVFERREVGSSRQLSLAPGFNSDGNLTAPRSDASGGPWPRGNAEARRCRVRRWRHRLRARSGALTPPREPAGRLRPCAGPAGVDGARSHPTPGRAGLDPRGGAFRQRRRAPGARGASYAGPLST